MNRAIRVLVALVIVVIFLYVIYQFVFPQFQRAQDVAALDALFSKPRTALPANMDPDTIFPLQVGDFTRSSAPSTSYFNGTLQIYGYVNYRYNSGPYGLLIDFNVLRNGLAPDFTTGCGDFVPGYNKQRLDTTVPYSYATCAKDIFSPFDRITGVGWSNGDREIRVHFERLPMFIEFLKSYPY